MHLSQPQIVAAIMAEVARQGGKKCLVNSRQTNAMIEAADIVVDAMASEHVPATPAMGLSSWLASDDTGLSSKAMAAVLGHEAGMVARRFVSVRHHPHDPADFGRCVRLLEAVPALRPHLDGMSRVSPVWAGLVESWGDLEELYHAELPTGKAPQLYARMREIIEAAPANHEATSGSEE